MSVQWNDRPKKTLGETPTIQSMEDVDKALQELGFLKAFEDAVNSECNAEVNQVKQRHNQRLRIPVGRKRVNLTDRRQALDQELRSFCEENQDTILADVKGKSREFNHGKVAWRAQPAAVTYAEKQDSKTVCKAIDKLVELYQAIKRWLDNLVVFGSGQDRVKASDLINLNPSVQLTKAQNAFADGRLTEEHLTELGLQLKPETEKLSISPAEYVVQSETQRAA